MIRQQGPVEGQPSHQPDYNVAADYRTSYVSPKELGMLPL